MDDATKILAMTECLILWDYLAETGLKDKEIAIRQLHREFKLSRSEYYSGCPFCEYLRDRGGEDMGCKDCLWPGEWPGNYHVKCQREGSHYQEWRHNRYVAKYAKASANDVLNLLLSVEF